MMLPFSLHQDAQRVRTENLELRARLAHAIYCSTEAQRLGVAYDARGVERMATAWRGTGDFDPNKGCTVGL